MNINITLLGQMITFAILVWVTMRYIWPPLTKALDERQATIAKGLQDAEERSRLLRESKEEAEEIMGGARSKARDIIKKAETQATKLVEEGKTEAKRQAQGILDRASADIKIEQQALKESMSKEIGQLAIACCEKLLEKEIGSETNSAFLEKLVANVNVREDAS